MKSNIKVFLVLSACILLFRGLGYADKPADKIFLSFKGEKYTLNPFDTIGHFYHFFGVYAKPLDLTSGINLYLFPDYKFIYTEWGDVWEQKTIASGSYSFQNGRIFLTYEYINKDFQKQLKDNTFHVLNGRIEKEDYVTGFISVLVNDEGIDKLRNQSDYFDYMERRTDFYNWQDIYKHFINNKK